MKSDLKSRVKNLWLSEPCAHRQSTYGASCAGCAGELDTGQTVLVCKCWCHGREVSSSPAGIFYSIGQQIRKVFQL